MDDGDGDQHRHDVIEHEKSKRRHFHTYRDVGEKRRRQRAEECVNGDADEELKIEKSDERGMQTLIRALPFPPAQPAAEGLRDEQEASGDHQPSVEIVDDQAD
jgi:hypothetical protein